MPTDDKSIRNVSKKLKDARSSAYVSDADTTSIQDEADIRNKPDYRDPPKSRKEARARINAPMAEDTAASKEKVSMADTNSDVLKKSLDTIAAILKETSSFIKNAQPRIAKIESSINAAAISAASTKADLGTIESRAKRTSAFLVSALENSKQTKRTTKSTITASNKKKNPVANTIEDTKENEIWKSRVIRLLEIIAGGGELGSKPIPEESKKKSGSGFSIAGLMGGLAALLTGKVFGNIIGGLIGKAVSGSIGLVGTGLKKILGGLVGILASGGKGLISMITKLIPSIDTLKKAMQIGADVAMKGAAAAGKLISKSTEAAGKLLSKTSEVVGSAVSKITEMGKNLLSKMPAVLDKGKDLVKKGVEGVVKGAEWAKSAAKSVLTRPSAAAASTVAGRYGATAATAASALVRPGIMDYGKALLKMGGKKLPVIGAGVGLALAANRFMDKDYKGAALEAGSGLLGATGLGIGGSIAADAYLFKHDKELAAAKLSALKPKDVNKSPVSATTQKLESVNLEAKDIANRKENAAANSKPIIIDNTKNISQGSSGKAPDIGVRILSRNTEPTKQFLDRLTLSSSYMGTGFVLT